MVSPAMEDYVAAIWRLTRHGGIATTSEVARALGVSAASTSYMFKKLAEAGLVEYKEYTGVSLSDQGEIAAAKYIRRHRLTERFLVEILDIPWDKVDALADQMEHALPDLVVERIDAVLGRPQTCPHGYPIPSTDGHLPDTTVQCLAELEPGEGGTVARVAEYDPALLTYFCRCGLMPGTQVSVEARDRVGETCTLLVGRERHIVGAKVLRAVFIQGQA